jgi:surfeit locus 1 family protein
LALGTWQVQRLFWKLDLIARVDARVHAPPSAAPQHADWAGVSRAQDEYRHVVLQGHWLPKHALRVQAVTELGSGFWLLMPLQQDNADVVWVNRGYVASSAGAVPAATGSVEVTGLLRLTEPGGAFLRHNDPAQNRWFSRDVAAMSAAQGLSSVAPYFVDADKAAAQVGPNAPVGGLTVVHFQNNHLVYALTWYTLAAGVLLGVWVIRREAHRDTRRQSGQQPGP